MLNRKQAQTAWIWENSKKEKDIYQGEELLIAHYIGLRHWLVFKSI